MLKKHKGDLFPRVMEKEADMQASQHALLQVPFLTSLPSSLPLLPSPFACPLSDLAHLRCRQHCVLPRALLSPADARYTARFFYLLLSLDMANFEALNFLALLATGVVPCVFSATEHEATNLGIFLRVRPRHTTPIGLLVASVEPHGLRLCLVLRGLQTLFEPLVDWFDNKTKFQAEVNKVRSAD